MSEPENHWEIWNKGVCLHFTVGSETLHITTDEHEILKNKRANFKITGCESCCTHSGSKAERGMVLLPGKKGGALSWGRRRPASSQAMLLPAGAGFWTHYSAAFPSVSQFQSRSCISGCASSVCSCSSPHSRSAARRPEKGTLPLANKCGLILTSNHSAFGRQACGAPWEGSGKHPLTPGPRRAAGPWISG